MRWLQRHRKALFLTVGSLMVIAALALFFWGGEKTSVSKEDRLAQANIARMESSVAGTSTTKREQPPINHIETIYEKRKQQTRYLLLLLAVGGIAFMLVGMYKKR